MYATASPSEATAPATIPAELRARGRLRIEALALGGRTVRGVVEEAGPSRVRFPLSGRRGSALEAVLINTGGGFAGGDSACISVEAGRGARLVVTSQSAEKIYRSDGATTRLAVDLRVEAGASLDWMPQATLLYDRVRVERSITAEVAEAARLLLVEPLFLGRVAHGETLSSGLLRDSWRIRRGGRLIYADGLDLSGDLGAILSRGAVAQGGAALATVLLVAPDAESRLDSVRAALGLQHADDDGPSMAALPEGVEAGASAWDGMLSLRLLARDGARLEAALRRVMRELGVAETPRIWQS